MVSLPFAKGKSYLVYGLGGSGIAAAKALLASGAKVYLGDDNMEKVNPFLNEDYTAYKGQSLDGFEAVILAPGIPFTHPRPHDIVVKARAERVAIIGDIALFCKAREMVCPHSVMIGITGTNGKSTCAALSAHLLREAGWEVELCGNIGKPILETQSPKAGLAHVVEISSYQIDLTPELSLSHGILLNITPDHIDRHGDFANYTRVKSRLIDVVCDNGVRVIGVDDRESSNIADISENAGRSVTRISGKFPLAHGWYGVENGIVSAQNGAELIRFSTRDVTSLRGSHNRQNAAAALAVCQNLVDDNALLQKGLDSFTGLSHRMEEVARKGNIIFINDSKATNAVSTAQALAAFDNIYWIAGGVAKEGGISELSDLFYRVRRAYLIGQAQDEFAKTLQHYVAYQTCDSLDDAVARAYKDAMQDELSDKPAVVLLSPACASFDQFANFVARGEAFVDLIGSF